MISTRILIYSFDISDVNIKTLMLLQRIFSKVLIGQLQSCTLTSHKMLSKTAKMIKNMHL